MKLPTLESGAKTPPDEGTRPGTETSTSASGGSNTEPITGSPNAMRDQKCETAITVDSTAADYTNDRVAPAEEKVEEKTEGKMEEKMEGSPAGGVDKSVEPIADPPQISKNVFSVIKAALHQYKLTRGTTEDSKKEVILITLLNEKIHSEIAFMRPAVTIILIIIYEHCMNNDNNIEISSDFRCID